MWIRCETENGQTHAGGPAHMRQHTRIVRANKRSNDINMSSSSREKDHKPAIKYNGFSRDKSQHYYYHHRRHRWAQVRARSNLSTHRQIILLLFRIHLLTLQWEHSSVFFFFSFRLGSGFGMPPFNFIFVRIHACK